MDTPSAFTRDSKKKHTARAAAALLSLPDGETRPRDNRLVLLSILDPFQGRDSNKEPLPITKRMGSCSSNR